MILIDTSIWISHLTKSNSKLKDLLLKEKVITHPFIIGELSCGQIKNRKEILLLLSSLPKGICAENDEILQFIENKKLFQSGLGLIDVHLLACAQLSRSKIWTLDKKLNTVAAKLKIYFQ